MSIEECPYYDNSECVIAATRDELACDLMMKSTEKGAEIEALRCGPIPSGGAEDCSDCGRRMVWQHEAAPDCAPPAFVCPNCLSIRVSEQGVELEGAELDAYRLAEANAVIREKDEALASQDHTIKQMLANCARCREAGTHGGCQAPTNAQVYRCTGRRLMATKKKETRRSCPKCGRGIGFWHAADESPCRCKPAVSKAKQYIVTFRAIKKICDGRYGDCYAADSFAHVHKCCEKNCHLLENLTRAKQDDD